MARDSDTAAPTREIPGAPLARVKPVVLDKHGDKRVDDYFWLRERDDPDVRAYLDAENEYTSAVLAPHSEIRARLLEEITGRIQRDDQSVPYRLNGCHYYRRFEGDGEYPILCRKKGSLEAPEEVMLDVNELASGHDFFSVPSAAVSSDSGCLAFAVDAVGRRIYTIRFRNLRTGETLRDEIPATTSNFAWAEDHKTLFYTRQDPTTLRWHRIYRHELGRDPASDELVYEEQDETFGCAVLKTGSKRFLMIECYQTMSTEYRFLPADDPRGEFRVVLARERGHEYSVDHLGEDFYIRTNWQARNFRLMRTPVADTAREKWVELLPQRDDVLFEGFELFRDHLVIEERENGLVRLRVRPWSGAEEHYLQFDEPAYTAWIDTNAEQDTTTLRFGYASMTTPRSVFDYEMDGRRRELLKQEVVLGPFSSDDYVTERQMACARDGKLVPISLVYRKPFEHDGARPLLLYGYGSYGASIEAGFRSERLSLLDRGFVYAIAHVRGGEELGRSWYEDGKLLRKRNTFADFIDCAEHLIDAGYADPKRVFAWGGSAGGLLVGAVINMRPDLLRGAIASVPFVDVLTTMLDDSIPLTTGEYDEWGDPRDPDYYDYIRSYSPYDNVQARDYPNLLVTTGLHDSQVQYWEPAKWVAKLRALKTDRNLLLLHTTMEAGHAGMSGRFRTYRETALQYAFLLSLAGADDLQSPRRRTASPEEKKTGSVG